MNLQNRSVGKPSLGSDAPRRLSPAQRAAIVIAVLGEEAAKPIVERLQDEDLEKVGKALTEIPSLPQSDLAEVVMEFLGMLRNSAIGLESGKSNAQALVSAVFSARHPVLVPAADLGEEGGKSSRKNTQKDVWQRLSERPEKQIAGYLNSLSPSLIALVLKRIDVEQSARILGLLNESLLQPVLKFMVESGSEDASLESIVGRMLETEFLGADEISMDEDSTHLETVGELLSLIPAGRRDALMAYLAGQHADKLRSIEGSLFTIESLPETLPRNAVPIVFRHMDMATTVKLLASLKGVHDDVSEFLLSNISARMADQVRESLVEAPEMESEEVDRVQTEFLTSLMKLKRAGTISTTMKKVEKAPA